MEALVGADPMVEVLRGSIDVDLHPADLAGECVVARSVVLGDRLPHVATDFERLVHREEQRMSALGATLADLLAVEVAVTPKCSKPRKL
jgi:hypothetical protein